MIDDKDGAMYIESVPNRGSPPAILLRESFRDQGRVRKRTLANLSAWPSALVEGFRTLLKGGLAVAADGIRIRRALPHGHAAAVLGTIRAICLGGLRGPAAVDESELCRALDWLGGPCAQHSCRRSASGTGAGGWEGWYLQ